MPNYTNALRAATKGISTKVFKPSIKPDFSKLLRRPPRATQTAIPIAKRAPRGFFSWLK